MCLAQVVNGQAGKNLRIRFDGNLQKNSVIADDQSLTFNYSLKELELASLLIDEGSFYRLSIPGHTRTTTPGKPELPVLSRLIILPDNGTYKIKISKVRSERINPARKNIDGILFPAQEGETKEPQTKKPKFAFDKSIYSNRDFLRSDTIRIDPVGKLRGKKIASLTISPVSYNPHSNVIEIITSMKIELVFTGSGGAKALYPESVLFGESFEKGMLNYDESDLITGYSDKPVRMVILTDTAFRDHLAPFLKWKTQKGFRLDVLYKGTGFAGDNYTEIKNTLTSLYNSSTEDNPPPEYLLIVGNTALIPYYGTGHVTDLYYGEFDGDGDYLPEMFIGRLPVADTAELKSVLNKIIEYEKFEFADTNKFYSNALTTAGYDASYASYMNGQVKYAVTNYLTTGNNINEYHFYYPQTQTAHKDSVVELINNGTSFINYSGHGSSTAWLHLNIDTSDVRKLTNRNMYPFVISNACQTARYSMRSLGNRMVLSPEKGAIGFIGCSEDSYWNEDFHWAVGLGTPSEDPTYETTGLGALDRLFHTHNEPPSEWYYTMGQVIYGGNLAVSSSTSSRKKYYWETYNLVGDPSVIPVIGTPVSFSTHIPDSLPNNIKSWSFTSEPFSYVAVSHSDTLWDASFASPSGSVTLEMPGLSDDSCLVVITGQNRLPLIKTIYFGEVTKEFVNLTRYEINDEPENNNGRADFGETLSLNLTISNLGLTDAGNLYTRITSTSEWITINTDSAMIGTLPAGSEITFNNKLSFTVDENIPDKGMVTLDLMLKDDVAEAHYKIDIYVHAPELNILSFLIDDSNTGNDDLIADPGETFRLVFYVENQGSSSTSGQFSITSSDADLTILEPTKNSGTLQNGEVTEIPVLVKLAESVGTGNTISIMSLLDCGPYQVDREFAFRVGRIRESFESSSFRVFPWINISQKPWLITSTASPDGNLSARSGAVLHNEVSSLIIRTHYTEADTVKFYYQVSSETNYDFFIFYLNDAEVFRKSGETLWEMKAIPVPAGYNKLEWIYKKDQSVSQGKDCALIDMIDFAGTAGVEYINRDLVVARIINPGQKENIGKELVTMKLLNFGPDTINGFNLAYTINDGIPVVQHFTDRVIPFSDSLSVTFTTRADLSRYGIYDFAIYSFNNDDDYLFNDTLRVNIENTEIDEPLSVFPNPFTERLDIVINSEIDATVRISLINSTGKKLLDFEHVILPGSNELSMENIHLPPAVYYLKIEYPGMRKTIPVIRLKP
jgi:hypothetical protein